MRLSLEGHHLISATLPLASTERALFAIILHRSPRQLPWFARAQNSASSRASGTHFVGACGALWRVASPRLRRCLMWNNITHF